MLNFHLWPIVFIFSTRDWSCSFLYFASWLLISELFAKFVLADVEVGRGDMWGSDRDDFGDSLDLVMFDDLSTERDEELTFSFDLSVGGNGGLDSQLWINLQISTMENPNQYNCYYRLTIDWLNIKEWNLSGQYLKVALKGGSVWGTVLLSENWKIQCSIMCGFPAKTVSLTSNGRIIFPTSTALELTQDKKNRYQNILRIFWELFGRKSCKEWNSWPLIMS